MFDWFWDLTLMVMIQDLVDRSRAASPGEMITIPLALVAIGVAIAVTTRARKTVGKLPGHYFLGKLTPKTLSDLAKRKRPTKGPKSRADHAAALRGKARRLRK
ncbi:MAG: hypothetical protein AAF281_15590 [Pseudomonadota bacterium]